MSLLRSRHCLWQRRSGKERQSDDDDGTEQMERGVAPMMIELVKCPVVTEKSVGLLEINQYTFEVDFKLTKPQIKQLIEKLFQVEVMAVNTHRPPRRRRGRGYTAVRKRAIITIKSGQSIPLFEESAAG